MGHQTNYSLGAHIKWLRGVVGPVCDRGGWLWCSEAIFSYRWGGEGDLLEVGYVVFLGVGPLECAVVERGDDFLSSAQ